MATRTPPPPYWCLRDMDPHFFFEVKPKAFNLGHKIRVHKELPMLENRSWAKSRRTQSSRNCCNVSDGNCRNGPKKSHLWEVEFEKQEDLGQYM